MLTHIWTIFYHFPRHIIRELEVELLGFELPLIKDAGPAGSSLTIYATVY